MAPESVEIADAYWASELGCNRRDLRPQAPRVQPHAGGLLGYSGVFVLVLDAAPIVSVPPPLLASLSPLAERIGASVVREPTNLRSLLSPVTITRVIGPALLHYGGDRVQGHREAEDVRALTVQDAATFGEFAAACPSEDWDPKGLSLTSEVVFGAFTPGGDLNSIAGIKIWRATIAHILVVTRPEARGRGYGTRVVAAATEHARRNGLLPQYRVLEENAPSCRVARKLGFEEYGWTIAARLALG
jgi:RimJ/RimL family protein N-acetyltransferase